MFPGICRECVVCYFLGGVIYKSQRRQIGSVEVFFFSLNFQSTLILSPYLCFVFWTYTILFSITSLSIPSLYQFWFGFDWSSLWIIFLFFFECLYFLLYARHCVFTLHLLDILNSYICFWALFGSQPRYPFLEVETQQHLVYGSFSPHYWSSTLSTSKYSFDTSILWNTLWIPNANELPGFPVWMVEIL